ncbi:MAG: hypothetical protein KF708_17970 [Pirellulales bacterium]|nr:hypothetical protein [Pirellulales bacterium]
MSQSMNHPPLRKAAILVASLDRETADRLVASMPAEEADRLYAEMARLGEIDPVEQRTIIDEFFRGSPPSAVGGDTLELSSTVEQQLAANTVMRIDEAAAMPLPNFEPLRSTDAATLASILADERPQIVALVMSQLPPLQAATVLHRLAPALQAEVMRRLSDLDEPDALTLYEVERVLSGRLDHAVRANKRRATGLAALEGILQAAEGDASRHLLDNLAQHDRQLAARLRRDEPHEVVALPLAAHVSSMTYAEFMRLDDRSLTVVFQSAGREVVLLALAGSTPQFVARVTTLFGATRPRQLDQAIESLGPLLLSDLEAAQDELARLASELLDEGVIEGVSPRATLSMAA